MYSSRRDYLGENDFLKKYAVSAGKHTNKYIYTHTYQYRKMYTFKIQLS